MPDYFPKIDVVSSLPLQMTLYFNIFYFPFWAITHICTLVMKYPYLSITYQVILIALHIFALLIEVIRLYLGFDGNLGEKIPSLSGFWIVTVILQLPLTSFLLLHEGIIPLPIERAVDSVHLVLVLVEVLYGLVAVRRVAKHQVTRFQQIMNKEEKKAV